MQDIKTAVASATAAAVGGGTCAGDGCKEGQVIGEEGGELRTRSGGDDLRGGSYEEDGKLRDEGGLSIPTELGAVPLPICNPNGMQGSDCINQDILLAAVQVEMCC